MSLTNFQDNLKLTFDYESKPKHTISFLHSKGTLIWISSLTEFIECLPVRYDQFVFADLGDVNYNLSLNFQGNVDKYLPLIYLHVLNKCGLHIVESIEINKTLRVIGLSDDIISTDSNFKRKRGSKVSENKIVYESIDLGSILKFISRSNQNLNFIIAEGLFCKQEVNLTIEKYEDSDIKEIAQYLNSVGIYVELVEEHLVYTVKKVE